MLSLVDLERRGRRRRTDRTRSRHPRRSASGRRRSRARRRVRGALLSGSAANAGQHSHGSSNVPGWVQVLALDDLRAVDELRVDPNPGEIALSDDGQRLVVTHFDLTAASKADASIEARLQASRSSIRERSSHSERPSRTSSSSASRRTASRSRIPTARRRSSLATAKTSSRSSISSTRTPGRPRPGGGDCRARSSRGGARVRTVCRLALPVGRRVAVSNRDAKESALPRRRDREETARVVPLLGRRTSRLVDRRRARLRADARHRRALARRFDDRRGDERRCSTRRRARSRSRRSCRWTPRRVRRLRRYRGRSRRRAHADASTLEIRARSVGDFPRDDPSWVVDDERLGTSSSPSRSPRRVIDGDPDGGSASITVARSSRAQASSSASNTFTARPVTPATTDDAHRARRAARRSHRTEELLGRTASRSPRVGERLPLVLHGCAHPVDGRRRGRARDVRVPRSYREPRQRRARSVHRRPARRSPEAMRSAAPSPTTSRARRVTARLTTAPAASRRSSRSCPTRSYADTISRPPTFASCSSARRAWAHFAVAEACRRSRTRCSPTKISPASSPSSPR